MQEVQFEIISALRAYLMIKLKFHNIRRMNSGTIVTIIIAYFTQIDLVTKTEQVMLITYLPIPFYLAVISYLLNFLIFLDVLYCSYLIIFACWGDWLNPFIIILGNFIWIVSIFKPRISSQHKPSLVCFLGSKSLTLPDKILLIEKIHESGSFLMNLWSTDEANFHLVRYMNANNNAYWGTSPPEELAEAPLHSLIFTAWVAISSRAIIDPFFFDWDWVIQIVNPHVTLSYLKSLDTAPEKILIYPE